MGSLEEAIREHLELKRLRGADPAEVAREQRDALDPPTGEHPAASTEGPAAPEDDGTDPPAGAPQAEPADPDHPSDAPTASAAEDLPAAGQETAELDMRAVLQERPASASDNVAPVGPIGAGQARASSSPAPGDGDSLDWEQPARSSGEDTEEAGQGSHPLGQERLSFE
jgi:hypothetical protein